MRAIRLFAAAALIAALTFAGLIVQGLTVQVLAAEAARACLNKEAQREAIASGKAIPLAQAMRAVHRRPGEVVKARLCQDTKGLVYLLTLLARDGKVTRATIDASNGSVITGR